MNGKPYEQCKVKGKVQHETGNLKRGLLKYASRFSTRPHGNSLAPQG